MLSNRAIRNGSVYFLFQATGRRQIMTQNVESQPYLDDAALSHKLKHYPSLIPIEIDRERRQVVWQDIGQYHFYTGNYRRELPICQNVLALDRAKPRHRLRSALTFFAEERRWHEVIVPSGFIFSTGRCGSSLLTRVLAHTRSHLVWGEAQPHTILPEVLTDSYRQPIDHEAHNLLIYRNLLLAMGRKRVATHQAHFIKFTSFQIHFFDFIQRAFPAVPKLFLYRNPAAVLVSYLEGNPLWKQNTTSSLHTWLTGDPNITVPAQDRLRFYTDCLANYMRAALATPPERLQVLNYNQLCAENLPAILDFFSVSPSATELTAMQSQFHYSAKTTDHWQPFVADEQSKAAQVTPAIAAQVEEKLLPLYRQLEARPRLID